MKSFSIFALLAFSLLTCSGCSNRTALENLGFELGTFSSWKVTGDAFSISSETRYDGQRRYYFADGVYHCLGSLNGIGTLQSPNFVVNGSGFISFLLGGSKNISTSFVSFYLLDDNQEIFRTGNDYFDDPDYTDSYLRVNVDLTSSLGKKIYIKVIDDSPEDYINVDGFSIVGNQETLTTYLDDANIRLGLSQSTDMREAADRYIKMNAWRIQKDQRFSFHLSGETGWINDPNGFSYFNEQIQLFYQHNPYSTNWGPMHWGHASSDDFVKWDYRKVALAPDQQYDTVGAFSGSAIEWNGQYYIVYTGASPEGQVQCLAISEDGINFEKYADNPIIGANDLPANTSIADFRDPKMFIRGDWVYLIVSARNSDNQYSKLLLYKTQNMVDWQYAGKVLSNTLSQSSTLGIMLECPDLIRLENRDVVLLSPQTVTNHRNQDGNVYIVGDMNWTNGTLTNFSNDSIFEIDKGFDFYAPTTMTMPDGRTIMVAWMAGWSRTPITSQFGYAGTMTFPRELSLVNNRLYQQPVAELSQYYSSSFSEQLAITSSIAYIPEIDGTTQDIELEFLPTEGPTGISVFDDGQGRGVRVYYDEGKVYLNRYGVTEGYYAANDINNITYVDTPLVDGKVKIRLLLDKYSLEVFTADGYGTMTATGMPNSAQVHVGLYSTNDVSILISQHQITI